MNSINVKMLSENALIHMKQNITHITELIQRNETNDWIYTEFPQPMFSEKKYRFNDFTLEHNPESKDKVKDLNNSITLHKNLKVLPRYVLTDEKFWLWLHLDKFYSVVRNMMKINGPSTITDHWMHKQGTRRGLMFGVLSRLYFRVAFSIDENNDDKYHLTKWVIENPERFRNLTWRSFSSQEHLVRGILKGEKQAVEESLTKEKNAIYTEIAKYVSIIGSVRLLDVISEDDIAKMIKEKMLELLN